MTWYITFFLNQICYDENIGYAIHESDQNIPHYLEKFDFLWVPPWQNLLALAWTCWHVLSTLQDCSGCLLAAASNIGHKLEKWFYHFYFLSRSPKQKFIVTQETNTELAIIFLKNWNSLYLGFRFIHIVYISWYYI